MASAMRLTPPRVWRFVGSALLVAVAARFVGLRRRGHRAAEKGDAWLPGDRIGDRPGFIHRRSGRLKRPSTTACPG